MSYGNGRLTDLQTALGGLVEHIRSLGRLMPPRPYALLVDGLWRFLDEERRKPNVARYLSDERDVAA